MGLEAASFLSDLNQNWPLDTDSATQGDDHLRLIKSVLRSTFPGSGGNGFSKQIIATEDELNFLSGVTSSVQSQLNAKEAAFPSGTILPFYNATPPPGWSLVTLSTNYMLTVGPTFEAGAGIHSPTINDKVTPHTHSASGGTVGEAGAHDHALNQTQIAMAMTGGAGNIYGGAGNVLIGTLSVQPSGAHTHSLDGLTIAENTGESWQPRYMGLILCSKN